MVTIIILLFTPRSNKNNVDVESDAVFIFRNMDTGIKNLVSEHLVSEQLVSIRCHLIKIFFHSFHYRCKFNAGIF